MDIYKSNLCKCIWNQFKFIFYHQIIYYGLFNIPDLLVNITLWTNKYSFQWYQSFRCSIWPVVNKFRPCLKKYRVSLSHRSLTFFLPLKFIYQNKKIKNKKNYSLLHPVFHLWTKFLLAAPSALLLFYSPCASLLHHPSPLPTTPSSPRSSSTAFKNHDLQTIY